MDFHVFHHTRGFMETLNVRSVAVSTLVNNYGGDDEAVTRWLTEIAQNDPSLDVRATADAMMEHGGGGRGEPMKLKATCPS